MEKKTTQERLLELMEIYGLSQADICRKTGIAKSAMSMYVNGKRTPRQNVIGILSDAYDINPAWIMGFEIPMKKVPAAEIAERDFSLITKFSRLTERDQALIVQMIDSIIQGYSRDING